MIYLSLVAKLAWGFLHEIELPWTVILRERYVKDYPILDSLAKSHDSTVWKCICTGLDIVKQGSMIRVGGGQSTDF